MPSTSSGVVSRRTSSTASPASARSFASLAESTILPVAAPGEAGRPCARTSRSASGSMRGWRSWSSAAGSTRSTASEREISPSPAMSLAILSAAAPVRLPLLVWSMYSRSRSMVNSMSCMSPYSRSSRSAVSRNCRYAPGKTSSISGSGRGVRMPATTSSPWAFRRNSPKSPCSPVAGSRVNATPVAEVSPMFPKTIRCTVTAVPRESGIPYSLRYATARSPSHESKTAPIASSSCS